MGRYRPRVVELQFTLCGEEVKKLWNPLTSRIFFCIVLRLFLQKNTATLKKEEQNYEMHEKE